MSNGVSTAPVRPTSARTGLRERPPGLGEPSVVIPAYNEDVEIGDTVKALTTACPSVEVVVTDDAEGVHVTEDLIAVAAYQFLAHVAVLAVVKYALTVMSIVYLFAGAAVVRFGRLAGWRAGSRETVGSTS